MPWSNASSRATWATACGEPEVAQAQQQSAPASAPGPAHTQPLTGSDLVLGTVALSLATFMNVLDSSIANVSLPAIAGNLGVSPTQGTWVITSFGVANAISVPLTGWLTQRFGAVRLFMASVLLFVLASWLCGFASSLEMLIGFRVLQGLVAGPMIPLSQTLLLSSYPRAKSGMALAMWSMTTLVAPVTGPLLGGWITDNMSWPWIFYINVPVGLWAAAVTWRIYAKRDTPTRKLPIDTVGLSLLVLWVGSLQIMLDKGKELDWFQSGQIVALAVVAAVGFVVFVAWELTEEHPIVDLRLFASRNFAFGSFTLSVAYCLFFGNVVLLPLWLQQFMGYTATAAGMAMAPVGILAIILSPFVGKAVTKRDPRALATVAFLGFALVLWMRSHFTTNSDFETIMIPTIMQGGAIAFFFIPLSAITLSGLPADKMASASGLSNFTRITAGAMGTSMVTTLWESRAAMHHAHLTERLSSADASAVDAFGVLGKVGMGFEQAAAQVNRLVDQQAFTRAADDVFLVSAWLFLALVPLVWMARRVRQQGAAVDAGGAH
ncbi:MAG: DHA2 family efflux MFS transporter permease subunit [Rubrivivax sp.]|nr:MAG: DHA2 family efflux MFS transporter permease subunit [Rubrivivax sp.]